MKNTVKTVALLAFMSTLVWFLGITLFPEGGYVIGALFAVGINLFAYFFSDKMAIAAARAVPVPDNELLEVHAMLDRLTQFADMPKPRLYFIDSPQPNAFATGRNPKHAVVAVTRGILELLSPAELEGVIAHELAHVKNRDILLSSIAAMLAAALAVFARMSMFTRGRRDNGVSAIFSLLAMILAPLAAMILRAAVSRTREFEADRTGAMLSGQPLHLASALSKISNGTAQVPMQVNPQVAQLFIDNPLKAVNVRGSFARLFSTHPPVEQRIERLSNQATGIR